MRTTEMVLGSCGFKVLKTIKLERGMKIYGMYGYGKSESGVFAVTRANAETFDMVEINGKHRIVRNHETKLRPISEEYGIGAYWNDTEPGFRYSEKEIKKALRKAMVKNYKDEQAKIEQTRKDEQEKERLLKEFDYLERISKDKCYFKTAVDNLRKVLKKRFPETKFKVHKAFGGVSSYEIEWTDGASEEDVVKIENLFKHGYFDGMTDSWENCKNLFADLFGSIDYIFLERKETKTVA